MKKMRLLFILFGFTVVINTYAQTDTIVSYVHHDFSWGITISTSNTEETNRRRKSCGTMDVFIKYEEGEEVTFPFLTHVKRSYHSIFSEYPKAFPIELMEEFKTIAVGKVTAIGQE